MVNLPTIFKMLHQNCILSSLQLGIHLTAAFTVYYLLFKNLNLHCNPGTKFSGTNHSTCTERNFPCEDRLSQESDFVLHGKFWILYNFIPAKRKFRCDESVTYTAPADLNFLDNLESLVTRWQGPVSISMYTPGTDFDLTINRIRYLRDCQSPLIKSFVTFHFFFEIDHFPKKIFLHSWNKTYNCKIRDSLRFVNKTYRKRHNLTFPLALARNIARERSQTHFFLNSDIEQYPNPTFITDFLNFISSESVSGDRSNRRVYVLPHFEVDKSVKIDKLPNTKTELQDLLRNKMAVPFHDAVCKRCHRSPQLKDWMNSNVTPGLSVFHVGRRELEYGAWEPFYVGTRLEPGFDERFTWESNKDKRIQAFIMCNLGYEYHVLDNAFLIHRPGIKLAQNKSQDPVEEQERIMNETIFPHLKRLYRKRDVCRI